MKKNPVKGIMLNSDFKDILSTLCAHKVEFMLVGAYALAAHGIPRATGDIDIWMRPTTENAKRVMNALIEFGAPLHDLTVDDLATEGIVFQMGVPPNRIDIINRISGVNFDTASNNSITVEIEDLTIPVIGRNDLLINKLATGRTKDKADVELLNKSE